MKDQTGNVFHAIAHPERRRILDALQRGESPALALAHRLSPSALSQHLTVLKRCGLVTEQRRGRLRVYRLRADRLREPFDWLSQYEAFWRSKLRDLETYLHRTHGRKDEDDSR